jgi:predicted nucleic-acid-binding Zn-ribbon protein
MKQTGKCPKCGSSRIIADAKAVDRGHQNSHRELSVATFRKPDAIFFKEKQETTVSAWVCSECGYVEFYADYPYNIRLPEAQA